MNYDITLKVTEAQLLEAFSLLTNEPPPLGAYQDKDQKRMKHFYSLWAEVKAKVAKKHISIDGKKKPCTFKLKYYEAATLHQILNVYDRRPHYAQQLYDQLDQKLA